MLERPADAKLLYTFFVPGLPATKGSLVGFHHPNTGQIIVHPDNAGRQKSWNARVSLFASGVASTKFYLLAADGVRMELTFLLPRPKKHFRTNGSLHPKAPRFPTGRRYDVDKLERCVLDALTGVMYSDDGQVVENRVRKLYAEGSRIGVLIHIELAGASAPPSPGERDDHGRTVEGPKDHRTDVALPQTDPHVGGPLPGGTGTTGEPTLPFGGAD
jgi:Holliday junction resolvase RusA-like endonuclease